MSDATTDMATDQPWRLRPAMLAAIGLIAAIVVQQLTDRGQYYGQVAPALAHWRYALASGVGVGAMAFGFGLERVRWQWSVMFGIAVGAVVGLVIYWNSAPRDGGFPWDWPSASLFLSIVILVPLFQTARDEGARRFPYAQIHANAWTNVVLWCACWLFVGIVFALVWLLAALFELIGLTFLSHFLNHHWVDAGLVGASFGAALGLLRDRDRVVRLLQRVVTIVLAVLAPVLAAGLLFFLVALPFTGLTPLWEATKSTTPILLACLIGGLILANAVIGNGDEEEVTNPVLHIGAMALALCALPLAVIAAIATGLRIGQYGFTPDRLWALVAVVMASAYGVAYLAALVRGRMGWAAFARPANLTLAFMLAGLALFLATPILSFNAISTHDQVARLESGRTTPDKFDWAALAFDFGDPGKAALKRLGGSNNAIIAAKAKDAVGKTSRYEVVEASEETRSIDNLSKRLRVLPVATPVPQDLRAKLVDWNACGSDEARGCTLLYSSGATEAFSIQGSCADGKKAGASSSSDLMVADKGCNVARFELKDGKWTAWERADLDAARQAALRSDLIAGKVEIRTVPRRQVFVGDAPVGDPFE